MKPLTSGRLARLLHTCSRTVNKWQDAGLFPGSYRLPAVGAGVSGKVGDRRFPAACVVAFCETHSIPVPRELAREAGEPTVAIGGLGDGGQSLGDAIRAAHPGVRVGLGPIATMLLAVGRDRPDAVILGPEEGLGLALQVATVILADRLPPHVALVLPDDADPADSRLDGVRSRLCWVGRMPPNHTDVIRSLNLGGSDGQGEEGAD